jgi:hypothetical protein
MPPAYVKPYVHHKVREMVVSQRTQLINAAGTRRVNLRGL